MTWPALSNPAASTRFADDRSIEPRGHTLLNTLDEPRQRILPMIENDVPLQDVVKIDVQAAMTIHNGNRPATVDIGPKLLVVESVDHVHGVRPSLLLSLQTLWTLCRSDDCRCKQIPHRSFAH